MADKKFFAYLCHKKPNESNLNSGTQKVILTLIQQDFNVADSLLTVWPDIKIIFQHWAICKQWKFVQ